MKNPERGEEVPCAANILEQWPVNMGSLGMPINLVYCKLTPAFLLSSKATALIY